MWQRKRESLAKVAAGVFIGDTLEEPVTAANMRSLPGSFGGARRERDVPDINREKI